MDDLVSRKHILLQLSHNLRKGDDEWELAVRNDMETVRKAPSVAPEPRAKAKWYKPTGMMPPEFTGQYRCSNCDELAMRDWKHHRQILTNFCPNCGADMREEKEQ